ncbi:MAG TPA: tetratricopeptide repeat protein, partial [Bacteroidetes bacterium]|nr:tetratricopeptide repeat protein [Bacteroidota bacterium]
MNKQLHTLLNDSFSHYKSRQLKKALNAAQIALEFGLNENGHAADLIDANLLLVRIYNTNGRYQNNFSFFEKAQYHVEEAEKLNSQLNDPNKAVTIKMFAGRIFINKKNFAKARQCLDEALALATQINNHEGVAGTMSLLSKLSILQNQVDQAVEWAQKALNWLEENIKTNHLQLWTDAWLYLSNAYLRKQDYSKSLEISQELLRGSRQGGHIEKEIFALRNIAVVCGVKSNYKIGMQYFLEALDKCKSIGYQELYAQLQVNIGTLYAHLYNYPEAIRRYKNVLHAHNNYLEDKNKLVIFNNLGNIYLSTHQPNSALEYFEKAYRLAQQLRIKAMQAHALAQLGRAKLQLNRLEEAKNDTITAQCLIDQLGNINGKQINLLNRAEIHFREGSLECAQKLTQKAIEAARLVKDDACEIRGYKHLSKVFKAKGDYKTALEYEEKYGKIQEAFAKE